LSSIFSWMRRKSPDWLAGAFAACVCFTSLASADTEAVRLGVHFRGGSGESSQSLGPVSGFLDKLKLDMPRFQSRFDDCPAIVAGPIEKANPRDQLRDTWNAVLSIRTECWVLLQFDPTKPVAPTEPKDQLTPAMIHGIMAGAERLSRENEELGRVLFTFGGGTIICKDKERCELSSPEVGEWANYSLYLDLILVHGDDWFIEVAQAYRGRISFVYGVLWRDTGSGGQVVKIFPDRW
jgi:hypothetical protein